METVKTKKNISLYAAFVYLNGLKENAAGLFSDEKFSRLYYNLKNYIDELLEVSSDGEIVDGYLVYEQETLL